jgi:hypothetical protein
VLPPDRVSAASLTEAGVANKSEPGQERRASAAAAAERGQRGRSERPSGEAWPERRGTRLRPRSPAAEAGGHVVLPCREQGMRAGVAQGHQESARERNKDHASGGNTTGTRPECHRGLPSAVKAVRRTTVRITRRGSLDTGVRQVKERAERRKSPPAGRDHRMAGLEQGATVRNERVANPGADAPRGDRSCHQVALEDES